MIIDCHMHAIETFASMSGMGEGRPIGGGRLRFTNGHETQIFPEWLGDKNLPVENLIEKLIKPNHIDKAVLMSAGYYGFQNLYYADILQKYPDMFISTCTLDPYSAFKSDILKYLTKDDTYTLFKFEISLMCGLAGIHPDVRIESEIFDEIYEVAEQKDMPIMFDLGYYPCISYRPDSLAEVAKKHPNIRFVCAHMLCPKEKKNQRWMDDILKLKLPNMWFDMSCLALFMDAESKYPFYDCIELVEFVANTCGSDKVMWGSDTPMTLCGQATYGQLFDYIQHSKKLSSSDLDNIYGKSAMACYKLG